MFGVHDPLMLKLGLLGWRLNLISSAVSNFLSAWNSSVFILTSPDQKDEVSRLQSHFLVYNLQSFMCKSFHKMAQGVTAGCLVQRNPGVKPARSTAVRVTEFTPELAPFPLKTRRVPDRLSSFLTLQDWGDLLPQYTAHINISSTCHHPGLQWVGEWGTFKELRSAFLKIYPLHFFPYEQTSPTLC